MWRKLNWLAGLCFVVGFALMLAHVASFNLQAEVSGLPIGLVLLAAVIRAGVKIKEHLNDAI